LFYANAGTAKERLLGIVREREQTPRALVLDLGPNHELDLETADMLAELADALGASGVELRLGGVHAPVLELLRRSGLAGRVRAERRSMSPLTTCPSGRGAPS
jgi:MFS superfamily sulfate permease-like transporter